MSCLMFVSQYENACHGNEKAEVRSWKVQSETAAELFASPSDFRSEHWCSFCLLSQSDFSSLLCWMLWAPDLMMFCYLSTTPLCLLLAICSFAFAWYMLNKIIHSKPTVKLGHSLVSPEQLVCWMFGPQPVVLSGDGGNLGRWGKDAERRPLETYLWRLYLNPCFSSALLSSPSPRVSFLLLSLLLSLSLSLFIPLPFSPRPTWYEESPAPHSHCHDLPWYMKPGNHKPDALKLWIKVILSTFNLFSQAFGHHNKEKSDGHREISKIVPIWVVLTW